MKIQGVKIENFRGFSEKEFVFDDVPVVLLTAPNGTGKTTLIDAIEWCLTGDIGRLKTAFDNRSTKENDRKKNSGGILKKRDAEADVPVKVTLYLSDGKETHVLYREQKIDKLDSELSVVKYDGSVEEAKSLINRINSDSFYNFHFCDIQKSFDIQRKKRADLKDAFEEFITNYDKQKTIAINLDTFSNDARIYSEKVKEKRPKEKLEDLEEQRAKAIKKARQISYPEITFYPNEKLDIARLGKTELEAQRLELINCGYIEAKRQISILLKIKSLTRQKNAIENIYSLWKMKSELIQQSIKNGLGNNNDAITNLDTKLKILKNLSLTQETVLTDIETLVEYKLDKNISSIFVEIKKAIDNKESENNNLAEDVKTLSDNNHILELLLSLSINKQLLIDYRDNMIKDKGIAKCPVCGSTSFSDIENTAILKEADDYIKKNSLVVEQKKIAISKNNEILGGLYKEIIIIVKDAVEKERIEIEKKISGLITMRDETKSFYDCVKELQKTGLSIDLERITTEIITELSSNINRSLTTELGKSKNEEYKQILTLLGYPFETEELQQTHAKLDNLVKTKYEVPIIKYDVLVSKINAIDSILANKELSDLNHKIEVITKTNNKIDEEIEKYEALAKNASDRAKAIREAVAELSKDEYEKIGPTLNQYYNKLSRYNYVNGINIVLEQEEISLVDDKGKNIVNVLSNGQISIFMLAMFFAGINMRSKQENMKVYFIDDLTACMDDVNMLAFMDLLKYQLSSKRTIDQLFFITCDERISELLKYKLNGRGIRMCELSEEKFM